MSKKKPKGDVFVLDGSVAVAWCFEDEANPYADAIAARFPRIQAVVPAIWPLEVANALLMGERRKRSTSTDTAYWLGSLRALPIILDDEVIMRSWDNILNLARGQNLSAYDASYLELALRRKLPLATLDGRLKAAAAALGVAEFRP